jgi:gamma-glutamyltranspeptidase / glutathione hydrolase
MLRGDMRLIRLYLVSFLLLLLARPAVAAECAIASAHPLATRAGCEILHQGGNAFDAAVAVTAALAVVEPYASGLGGGGFYLLHRAADEFEVFIDARETAPARATRELYLDENGEPRHRASLDGASAAAIPGTPAAIDWIATRYGTLSLERLLAPAIALAEQGFPVDSRYLWAIGYRETLLKSSPGASVFLDNGARPQAGYIVRQPQLAKTLRIVARSGRDGFYRGQLARELVKAVVAGGGMWDLDDLAGYRLVEREPFTMSFRGARISTAPLPSSGGLVMAQALQILEPLPLEKMVEAQRAHFVAEAMRRGYNDRARYMGDPDFVDVPVARLASRKYALSRAASISADRATPSSELPDVADPLEEGSDTTHFSIVDREGNRVAATLSVNAPFGAGVVAGDTGVLLNNHMNDFSLAVAAPNLYRLVGNQANAIEPGKRPLSSMSPTFVADDRGVLVLGTPGGSRIISMVLLGVLDYTLNPQVNLARIAGAPRYHHQYLPDRIQIESEGFSDHWVAALRAKGHTVESAGRRWGNMQVVFRDAATGRAIAESDPRGSAGVLF